MKNREKYNLSDIKMEELHAIRLSEKETDKLIQIFMNSKELVEWLESEADE